MVEAVATFFENIARSARLADAVDVFLASVVFFALIAWARNSTSRVGARRVLVVAGMLVAVYAIAQRFEMFLVETISAVLLGIMVLGAAVVFQTDIRRIVDRLGSLRLRRLDEGSPSPSAVDVITDAAAKMASIRRGALMVVGGAEPWDRYIEGGIRLDGTISQPLLVSIFNPSSPGHDGAVLIRGGRITRFGAHLPLSTHLPQVSRHGGTRHAAALGLAEQCDAFVVVVSEERGTVSVAEEGTIEEVSASELKARLLAFWKHHYETTPREKRTGWWRQRRRLQSATLAVSLAVVLWLLFVYSPDTVYRNFEVPVEFRNLKSEWLLEDPVPAHVQVTLEGSGQAFRGLDASELVVALDLSRVEEGENELLIAEDNMNLPKGVSLFNVDPQTLDVTVQRQKLVQVAVNVQTSGALPDSLRLVSLSASPDSIALLVPSDDPRPPTSIPTEPVDLGDVSRSVTLQSRLVPPDGTRLPSDRTPQVSVRIEVQAPTPMPDKDVS